MPVSTLLDIAALRARAAHQGRTPAGGRPAAAPLTLGADGSALPAATELAALLTRVPVAGVRLARTADFSALPAGAVVRIIALLRECASTGAAVSWSLTLGAERLDLIPRLDHLPVPETITIRDAGAGPAPDWRSARHFGLLHFRKGSGFLSVVDDRPESRARTVLDTPAAKEVFLRALDGRAWSDLTGTPAHAAAARDLVGRGLLLRLGDHCVTLPVHMRSWPLGAALLGGTLASAGKKKED